MESHISADKLVKLAKKHGIDFGKADPYNRLRYYTKIGWLPHMERMKTPSGQVSGHYPHSALETLILIENSKKAGLSNSEIEKRISSLRTKQNLGSVFKFLSTPEKRLQTSIYACLGLLFLIFLSETGAISLGNTTKQDIISAPVLISSESNQILDSGSGIVPEGDKAVFVKSPKINPQSKVYVTFEDNYSPASKFWVSGKVSFEGFTIELDSPVAQNSRFSWWLSN